MAIKVQTMNGHQLLVKIGNGASPETFATTCLINTTRGIQFGSSPVESNVPFCDEPALPGWIERVIDGLTATINGAGMVDTPSIDFFWEWLRSGVSKNVQVWINVADELGGGYWYGAAVLSAFDVTGDSKAKAETTSTILSDGEWRWADAGT